MKLNRILFTGAYISSFIVLLLSIYALHSRFLRVDVVFYSAILDALIAAIITLVTFVILFRKNTNFDPFHYFFLFSITILGGYAFAISIPTVLDRSLSIYIVEKIEQRGGGVREDALADIFINEYIPEHSLLDIRLTEQLESATIYLDGECVRTTNFGKIVARATRYLRTTHLPKKRKILNQYSDELTDPFRNSAKEPQGYEC